MWGVDLLGAVLGCWRRWFLDGVLGNRTDLLGEKQEKNIMVYHGAAHCELLLCDVSFFMGIHWGIGE